MAKKLYPETDIQNIANAIRALNGSSDTYTVGQMASAIVLPENAYYLKESASANPLSITDGEELKCQSAVVAFTPVQSGSGDHSPENPRPISGWDSLSLYITGINQWDEEWELGYYNLSTGAKMNSSTTIRSKNYIPVLPSTGYYFKCISVLFDCLRILWYDSDKNYISNNSTNADTNRVITSPVNAHFCTIYFNTTYGTIYRNDISINYPATDTNYHAYQGKTYTKTFISTVYGGKLDMVSGKLTSEIGIYTIPEIEELREAGGNYYANFTIRGIKSVDTRTKDVICECVPQIDAIGDYLGIYHIATNIVICVGSSYTVSEFNQNIAGNKVAYPFATPTEITLTPEDIELLKGSNTVWSDGDTVQLEYWSKSNTTPLLNMLSMNTINISNINNENNENEVEEIPIEESEESLEEIENIDNSENE